jgi:hypothetical protein
MHASMANYEGNSGNVTGWKPLFVREIREQAEAKGILQATHDILVRDNVTVQATGHVDAVREHPGGVLFVGNHNKQFEFVALMDFLSQAGRTSMKNIVKFYVREQVNAALGRVGTDIVLPVYPRLLATDRANKLNLELASRIKYRNHLKTLEESQHLNDVAVQLAAEELSGGGIVNIFPVGRVSNNMKSPWREGVGRILTRLPEEARDEVLVVPYHADNINRFRLLAAVAVRGKGLLGAPQHIDLTLGQPATAAEMFDTLPEESPATPQAITEVLRAQYAANFSPDSVIPALS